MDSRGGLAARIVSTLGERGQTLATAESLTGGMLGAAITAIPGASVVYRGGVIAYATELKTVLLGVPAGLLAQHGPVHPDVAAAMAAGVRDRLGATWGLATTGVAGPDPVDGLAPGTVHIGASAGMPATRALALAGERNDIRRDTVREALKLLWRLLREDAP
ncbi:MAG TPA: CinA family protein [Streptosporangiaceae bacterium]|nr:CinA family protein [Streptosporangiaceae bacterium]